MKKNLILTTQTNEIQVVSPKSENKVGRKFVFTNAG